MKAADPVLFLTLTKAGKTVQEAARALTTFVQALRRGSKGRGPNHLGARPSYPIEYFAVLERHKDFARNGFHWHVLLRALIVFPIKRWCSRSGCRQRIISLRQKSRRAVVQR